MVRLDSGSVLVDERDTARIKEIQTNGNVRNVGTIPGVHPAGEGGLLGITVYYAPDGAKWLYVYKTSSIDNRVSRFRLSFGPGHYKLGPEHLIFNRILKGNIHNGGRIKFGPDGMLYITAGETGNHPLAQSLSTRAGKIFRITPTGGTPSDNPFPKSNVFSTGHRNPQGIAWDPSGQLWASELGQNTWDELNKIVGGKNYGWPVVEGMGNNPLYVDPVHVWSPSQASPSGLLYSHGTLFMAALRGERLWVINPADPSIATAYFTGVYGRIRDVIDGPGDTIWIATSNTGRSPKPGDDKILQFDLAVTP
jgi:glucose/arabinose dehydrogenase